MPPGREVEDALDGAAQTGVRVSPSEEERYWDARLRGDYSLRGVGFEILGERFNSWLYRVRQDMFARTIASLRLAPGARVLDVGSGTGFLIETWREEGFTAVEGSDISSVAVEGLKDRFPTSVIHHLDIGSDETASLGRYEAVSANDVLFHITDDAAYRRALRAVGEMLEDGGFFLFTDFLVHGPPVKDPHHAIRSFDGTMRALADAGLDVVDRHPMFVLMNTPVDSNSRLLRAWWQGVFRVLRRWPRLGGPIGAACFLPEKALCRRLREGPSTELLVCRRRSRR